MQSESGPGTRGGHRPETAGAPQSQPGRIGDSAPVSPQEHESATAPWSDEHVERIARILEKTFGNGAAGVKKARRLEQAVKLGTVLQENVCVANDDDDDETRDSFRWDLLFETVAKGLTDPTFRGVLLAAPFQNPTCVHLPRPRPFVEHMKTCDHAIHFGAARVLPLPDGEEDSPAERRVVPRTGDVPAFKQMPIDRAVGCKPLVIAGSSGSGKTDFMITGGYPSAGAVLYARPGAFPGMANFKNASTLEERTERNLVFVDNFLLSLRAKKRQVLETAPHDKFAQDDTAIVRVVIDEVGCGSPVARAFVAACDKIRETVAKELAVAATNVHLLLGGTGSASPDVPWGSEPGAFDIDNMDRWEKNFAEHFKGALPESVRLHLDRATAAPSSFAAWEHRAMLTNPRLGALLANHAGALGMYRQRASASQFPSMTQQVDVDFEAMSAAATRGGDAALSALSAHDAIVGFFGLNGLRTHLRKKGDLVTILAQALAIDVGCYDGIAKEWLRDDLLTKYGVLQDRAVETRSQPVNTRVIERIVGVGQPSSASSDATPVTQTNTLLVVPMDCKGRYEMPVAYRAMLLRLWFGDAAANLHEVGAVSEWELLERHAWRWVAALTACVTKERSLEDLVRLSSVGRLHAATDTVAPLEDPLGPYRGAAFTELLVAPTPVDATNSATATIERFTANTRVTPEQPLIPDLCRGLRRKLELAKVDAGVALVELNKQMPFATNAKVPSAIEDLFMPTLFFDEDAENVPTRPLGVTMLNAPQAPFADVVGHVFDGNSRRPKETLLAQVKRYGASKPSFHDELDKIGARIAPRPDQPATSGSSQKELDQSKKRDKVGEGIRELCQRHGLFVAIVASESWTAIGPNVNEAAARLLRGEGTEATQRAFVLHLQMNPDGTWAKRPGTWVRPVLFPLILDDQTA